MGAREWTVRLGPSWTAPSDQSTALLSLRYNAKPVGMSPHTCPGRRAGRCGARAEPSQRQRADPSLAVLPPCCGQVRPSQCVRRTGSKSPCLIRCVLGGLGDSRPLPAPPSGTSKVTQSLLPPPVPLVTSPPLQPSGVLHFEGTLEEPSEADCTLLLRPDGTVGLQPNMPLCLRRAAPSRHLLCRHAPVDSRRGAHADGCLPVAWCAGGARTGTTLGFRFAAGGRQGPLAASAPGSTPCRRPGFHGEAPRGAQSSGTGPQAQDRRGTACESKRFAKAATGD